MSFILDALKKSEAERQRQVGPTLLEVRITRPRRRLPLWALVVALLLGLNMLLLAFVLHKPASSNSPETGGVAVGGGPPPAAASAPPALPAAAAPVAAVPVAAVPVAAAPAAASALAAPVAAAASTAPPGPAASPAGAATLPRPARAAAASSQEDPQSAGDAQDDARNPADEEPAVPRHRAGANAPRAAVDDYASWPSLSEVGGGLPDLRLDLHVYAERSRDRYALINMHTVHEGDVLPEGPRVVAITRTGVALTYHGQNFMLHPQ